MGVSDHHATAPKGPFRFRVVVVSTTRDARSDESGALIADLVTRAGHRVLDRIVIPDDADRIRELVAGYAGDGETEVTVLTGGTGLSALDQTPEAVETLFEKALPGFGELFRWLSFQEVGSAAMLSRATAGIVGPTVVFALPGSPKACRLAIEKLVLPEIGHVLREMRKETAVAPVPAAVSAPSPAPSAPPSVPAPQAARRGALGVESIATGGGEAPAAEVDPEGPQGWQKAVRDLGGTVLRGGYPSIPEALEQIAPVVDVLHGSGERGVLELPNGQRYALFGWPDLSGPRSKVLAIGWGAPFGEVVALHRPKPTGVCIDEGHGILPGRAARVDEVCERTVGAAPKDGDGELFALQGDAVWIARRGRVARWDGRREVDDGTPKQVIASLVLQWSQR